MATEEQTTQWSQKDRQHNNHKRTDNSKVTEGQTTQWPQKDRQHNGHKGKGNTMATEGQTTQWPQKDKVTNKSAQSALHRTQNKDRTTRVPIKKIIKQMKSDLQNRLISILYCRKSHRLFVVPLFLKKLNLLKII